jgi:hypothetical protein
MVILEELRRLRPEVDVVFVSYGTGAATLREGGHPVIDMELPEDVPFLGVLIRAGHVILRMRPHFVVAHEEFAALPAAKLLRLHTLLLVDFFPRIEIWTQSLLYADRVIFMERRGLFPEPSHVRGKVRYTGPVIRPLSYGRADRRRARVELELPPEATVISIVPGAWATEERSPIHDLVIPAFRALSAPQKKLVWVAGKDFDMLRDRLFDAEDVLVLSQCSPIERLMVASDLVITKANRGTTLELAHLGIRSVSLSHGLNAIDEAIIPRIATNVALHAKGVDSAYLCEVIARCLGEDRLAPPDAPAPSSEGGAAAAAAELAAFMGARHPPS